jgi:hypothetical protein
VNIRKFMEGYKVAWELRDPSMFAALFHADGQYHNTPFQVQRGRPELAEYWKRVQLQENVQMTFEVLATEAESGIAALACHVPGGIGGTVPGLGEVYGNESVCSQARRSPATDGVGRCYPRQVR